MPTYPELSLLGVQNPPVGGVDQPELIYEIADAVARAALNSSGNNIIAWKGDDTPVVSNIPAGVVVTYEDVEYTGTLQPDDPSVQPKSRYLVYRGGDDPDGTRFEEYVVVQDPNDATNIWWESLGFNSINLQDLGLLAYEDAVILEKGSGDMVLGQDTQFQATAPTVTVTQTEKGLAAVATGTTVGASSTENVIKSITPSTDSFLKKVTPSQKKLSTTTVKGVKSNTTTASKVTTETKKLKKATIKKVTNASSVSYPSVGTSYNSTLKKLTINITSGVLPTYADQDIATGDFAGTGDTEGAAITMVNGNNDVTVPIADDSPTTVATGSTVDTTQTTNVGAVVLDDVSTPSSDKADAVTGMTTTPQAVVTGVAVTAQPTVTIQEKAKDAGDVNVMSGATATASAPTVSAGNNDLVKVAGYDALSVQAGDLTDMDDETV